MLTNVELNDAFERQESKGGKKGRERERERERSLKGREEEAKTTHTDYFSHVDRPLSYIEEIKFIQDSKTNQREWHAMTVCGSIRSPSDRGVQGNDRCDKTESMNKTFLLAGSGTRRRLEGRRYVPKDGAFLQ